MKLHRLVLTNYRGISHREVHFPDSGVVVIFGANEVGKTSMIEALDLLLESKDRSTKKEVKQVKPTHADVGSEILAEISSGPYRFVYRKRFHKKCETELTILTPRREQLTGDEAHERVLAILGQTVDTELWHAQRVLQTGSMAAVDLSGCEALSRALDVAAGGAAELSGSEPALLERIDAEFGRYFTGTGRPTGEWAAAISALSKADTELARCAAAMAEVDERVCQHVDLTGRLAQLIDEREAAIRRSALARQAAESLTELREQIDNARLVAAAAQATSAVSAAAQSERVYLKSEISSRTEILAKLELRLSEEAAAEASAREAAEIAGGAAEESAALMAAVAEQGKAARGVVSVLMARQEENQLSARLQRIRSAEGDVRQLTEQLSNITLTDEVMRDIESAVLLVQRLEAQLALAATTVEFTAAADIEIIVAGERIRLAAGETWVPESSAPTTVELPGQLAVRIHPGVKASDIREKLDAAQMLMDEVLAQGGAADIGQARELDGRRRTLKHDLGRARADLAALIGNDPMESLVSQLAALRVRQIAESEGIEAGIDLDAVDLEAAKRDLAETAEALAHSHRDVVAKQKLAGEARERVLEKASAVTNLRQQMSVGRDGLAVLRERLTARQAEAGDDEVAVRAMADAQSHRDAQERAGALIERLAQARPDEVDGELKAATAAFSDLDREYTGAERALNDIVVELAVIGTEGRQGNLDAAQIAREHAAADHLRVARRARAAQLLRSVMSRHREDTRRSYVAPFRTEIERLGRSVFGETFEIEVDSDLRICHRTLDGRTVPYDSLSGGAKEQLAILARLAGAALVAKEDSVPVIIDDALGFSDPDRLIKMGAVFDEVGDDGQVIVLTCSPTRYSGIDDAHFIELTAS